MRIIGVDLHARQQTIAMLDPETGELVEKTLKHEGETVREFYSALPHPVLVGIEATGSMHWFLELLEELGIERQVGHPAEIRAAEPRKQKHDRRDAALLLKLQVENRFPSLWVPSAELRDLRALLRHRHQWVRNARTHAERAAGHCLGEWFTTWSLAVELRRTSQDRVLAVDATRRLSAQHVAGDVQDDGIGDREPD